MATVYDWLSYVVNPQVIDHTATNVTMIRSFNLSYSSAQLAAEPPGVFLKGHTEPPPSTTHDQYVTQGYALALM